MDTRRNRPNILSSVFGSQLIYFVVAQQLWCQDVVMSLRTCFSFFLLGCLVEMLVNAGQEMDSARDCKNKFSINLVVRKPEYRTNPVNYPFGIQFILLLNILRTLRHKWLSTRSLWICCFCLSVLPSLLLLLRSLQKTSKIRTNDKKVRSNFITRA